MITDTRFQVPVIVASNAGNAYLSVPYRCVVRNVRAIPQAALASASSGAVAVTNGSTAIGAVAYTVDSSGAAAAGVPGTYTANASTGSTVLAANAVVKFAATATSQNLVLDVELDPHARTL